jgi:uncharacterized protein
VSWPPQIGELLPRAQDAYGVHEKLAGYSLSLEHAVGGHKAGLFEAVLDITTADVDYLLESLIAGIADTPIRAVRGNAPHGHLCEVRIGVRGLRARSDRTAIVVTAWEIAWDGDAPRLVTALLKG